MFSISHIPYNESRDHRREVGRMKDFLFHYGSGVCIAILALLEVIVLFLPGAMSGPFAYVLLAAFIAVIVSINLNSLHRYLKRRHKGGCSL